MAKQRNLVRTLGMGYVVIFVVANIIGSGVYKKIAPMAAELHSSIWILHGVDCRRYHYSLRSIEQC